MKKLYYINLSHYNFCQRVTIKKLIEGRNEGILGILYNTERSWWNENWHCQYMCHNLHYNVEKKVWSCLTDFELNRRREDFEVIQLDFKEFLEHYKNEKIG